MFAPQWNYKEFESFVVTDEYIRDAVKNADIKDLDITKNKGPIFDACKKSFESINIMLDMSPKEKPSYSDSDSNSESNSVF